MTSRPSKRQPDQLREISITPIEGSPAEGAVIITLGNTKVHCTASWIEGVPRFLKDSRQGWLTAEYSMLPRATHTRTDREVNRGKPSGRTTEIQRLIGRSLRSAIDLKKMPNQTIIVDCDVLQADGGTRTAAITGGMVAVILALQTMQYKNVLTEDPVKRLIAAISVGVYKGQPILDLDYTEDSKAETDCNVIMCDGGEFIEVQGTAEGKPFSRQQLDDMLALAESGIQQLFSAMKPVIMGQVRSERT